MYVKINANEVKINFDNWITFDWPWVTRATVRLKVQAQRLGHKSDLKLGWWSSLMLTGDGSYLGLTSYCPNHSCCELAVITFCFLFCLINSKRWSQMHYFQKYCSLLLYKGTRTPVVLTTILKLINKAIIKLLNILLKLHLCVALCAKRHYKIKGIWLKLLYN